MNNSGKTLTIFLVVIAVLLVSLTAIAVFFFLQEVELRKSAETNLSQMRVIEAKLQNDMKEAKKQLFLFEEKNKEGNERIESLLQDLELEQGLREEMKKDYRELRELFEKEAKAKSELEEEMTGLEEKNALLQRELTTTAQKNKELQNQLQALQGQYQEVIVPQGTGESIGFIEEEPGVVEQVIIEPDPFVEEPEENVELQKIVVNASSDATGRIITIDEETNFIIVDIGENAGIEKGNTLSIYRNESYLGDVKVTRVLPEMSAADFVAPLTSDKVRKNDSVVIKQ